MTDRDFRNNSARGKWPLKFGLVESFILIFILFAGFELFVDYSERISSARNHAEKLFVQSSRNVQVELGHIHDTVNVVMTNAQAYHNAGMLDPANARSANARSANAMFISYITQYPFITSINTGDAAGNGYLLLRTGKQLKNRIKKADEKGLVTWTAVGDKGEVISSEKRRDDYDPRKTPWYQSSVNRKDIVWSDPYSLRTTRDVGITASMCLDSREGSREVIGVDIMLKDISLLLAGFTSGIKGMTAHLLLQDGTVIASSDSEQFFSLLPQDDAPLARIGNGRYPIVEKALQSRTTDKAWSFNSGSKRFLAIMEPVSFSPSDKYNLVLTAPEDALSGNFTRDALWKLIIEFLLLATAGSWYFVRYLIPLRRISTALKEFGAGNSPSLPVDAARNDEIGVLASEFIQMTDALAKQEQFTENLIENSAAATFVLDPQHKVILWNKACEELTGIAAADMVGTDHHWQAFYDHERPCLSDIVLEADFGRLPDLYDSYEKSTLVPDGLHAEGWYHELNGHDRYILFDAAPVYGGSGEIHAVIETLNDVTRQKRADEALQENTERMTVILDGINALIYVADLETHEILFVNRYGRDIWGDITGKICWETLQDGQSGPCAFCTNDRLLTAGGEPAGVYAREFQNTITGSWYDCRDQAIRWSDGRLVRMEIATDITERKRSEADLHLLNTALRAAVNAVVITDKSGSIEWVNPAFSTLTGYSAEEAIGKNPRELVKSGVHDQAFFKEMWTKLLAGEIWRGQMTNRHKNGDLYPEGQTITPVKDASGEITHFIAIKRDLTENFMLEEQLRQSQKMESVGTLAGGIAHDFNNILTAIIGYGQLTLMKMPADHPLRYNINCMLEGGKRAARLTQDLLLFSRKQTVGRKPIDLNEVVVKVEKFLKKVISEDIAYKTAVHETPIPVLADEQQLEQVLMNLATNARDSMPQGGTLKVTTTILTLDEKFISAHGYGKPGPYALITVTDTGLGMDEETRRRIFEPFFTTKEVGKGTGLGLAVSYGIIKQHDGYINVYSEPGIGTTFRIYLPAINGETVEERRTEQEKAVVGGSETILIAEDDELVRRLEVSVLTEQGYTVIEAADGAEAVSRFTENSSNIDLLLLDLIMPKMNGKEACDEILKIRSDIKTIFSSGYAPDTIQQKRSIANGVNLIAKPISPNELLRKVRSVLDEE